MHLLGASVTVGPQLPSAISHQREKTRKHGEHYQIKVSGHSAPMRSCRHSVLTHPRPLGLKTPKIQPVITMRLQQRNGGEQGGRVAGMTSPTHTHQLIRKLFLRWGGGNMLRRALVVFSPRTLILIIKQEIVDEQAGERNILPYQRQRKAKEHIVNRMGNR